MDVKPLTREQVARLYAVCDTTLEGRRDEVLLVLLFNCGLSPAEIADLRVQHLDFERRWLWVVQGFRQPRFVPLNQRAMAVLQAWVQQPGWRPKSFVLGQLPDGRRKLKEDRIRALVQAIGARAGEPFTPEQASATLAQFLFDLSEEGQAIRNAVPAETQHRVRLPLENMPPFSVVSQHSDRLLASKGFIPVPWEYGCPPQEDQVIARGRALLEKAGAYL